MDGTFYTQEFYLSVGLGILGFVFLIFLIFLVFKKPKPNKFDPVVPKRKLIDKIKSSSQDKKSITSPLLNREVNPLQSPKRYQRKSFK